MSGWPVELVDGDVRLRPLRHRDARAWRQVRSANLMWLQQWEATSPEEGASPPTFPQMLRSLKHQARAGKMLPFVVEYQGGLVGQVTVAGITWGSLQSAHLGYWIDERVAGRGIIPLAVAMTIDHCLFTMGLHRVEVNIRPENVASLRVAEKLQLRDEGTRAAYLHIDGRWREHRSFAVTVEDVPGGLVHRLRRHTGRPAAS